MCITAVLLPFVTYLQPERLLSTTEQFFSPFYGKTIRCDRFLHIHYDRLWKIRQISDMLNDTYSKYYALSEHLAVDKVIVSFNGQVIFKQYLPKKHKCLGIKIYQL
jgi:hypothetical protein